MNTVIKFMVVLVTQLVAMVLFLAVTVGNVSDVIRFVVDSGLPQGFNECVFISTRIVTALAGIWLYRAAFRPAQFMEAKDGK